MVAQPARKGVSTLFYKHGFFQVQSILSVKLSWVSFIAACYSQVDNNTALSYITANVFFLYWYRHSNISSTFEHLEKQLWGLWWLITGHQSPCSCLQTNLASTLKCNWRNLFYLFFFLLYSFRHLVLPYGEWHLSCSPIVFLGKWLVLKLSMAHNYSRKVIIQVWVPISLHILYYDLSVSLFIPLHNIMMAWYSCHKNVLGAQLFEIRSASSNLARWYSAHDSSVDMALPTNDYVARL